MYSSQAVQKRSSDNSSSVKEKIFFSPPSTRDAWRERRAAEQHRLSRRAGRAAGAVDAAAVETQARLFWRVRAAVRAAVELRSEPRKTHEPQLKDRLDMFGRIKLPREREQRVQPQMKQRRAVAVLVRYGLQKLRHIAAERIVAEIGAQRRKVLQHAPLGQRIPGRGFQKMSGPTM